MASADVQEQKRQKIESDIQTLNQTKKKAIETEEFTLAHQCKLEIAELQQELEKVTRLLELLSASPQSTKASRSLVVGKSRQMSEESD